MEETRTKYGSIVALFDKTPPMTGPEDVHCPHFWEVKPYNGCRFDCQWCYLNGTFRYKVDGKAPYRKDTEEIRKQLGKALGENDTPSMYNVGEVADGLLFPSILFEEVIPIFREFYPTKGHKLLIVTKDAWHREKFYKSRAHQFVVVSYSVNAGYVSQHFEKIADNPFDRLSAAKYVSEIGYEVRLRVDPMVPVKGYQDGYRQLNKKIMEYCPNATAITLGSLRGLNSTITAAKKLRKDLRWTEFLTDKTSWGLRIPHDKRKEMYMFEIQDLRAMGYKGDITLCKETLRMWNELEELHLVNKTGLCNCVMEAKGHEPRADE